MSRTVGDVAQWPVWSIGPDVTLAGIRDQMVQRRLTWAPVLEGGSTLLGVVSAWDLLRHQAEGRAGTTAAWQLCTYQPLSVAPDTPVLEAAAVMRRAHVHHLLVVDGGRRLVGVVSSLDLLAA